jgi:hypothetical protein
VLDSEEHVPIRVYVDRLLAEKDLRDQQRYDAQAKAIEAAMAAADKAVQAALQSAEKAVAKAEMAAERRFESVNEFRGQLADQQRTFLPRQEYQVQHEALGEKLEAMAKTLSDRIDANSKLINDALLGLSTYQADVAARRGVHAEQRSQANWSTGVMVSATFGALGALLAIASLIFSLTR